MNRGVETETDKETETRRTDVTEDVNTASLLFFVNLRFKAVNLKSPEPSDVTPNCFIKRIKHIWSPSRPGLSLSS